ncbi:sensor histidine kinase [Oryzifoliimicrobium ureilyticus]|uniref:sensor histidine kinase n=1 Tax=Oryzifoliimicrobium ureilyticus TaxID=3113724 RepID=UPI003076801C
MINRAFLSSIAFRLPFAIAFICVSVLILSSVAIYGLQRARNEMSIYSVQAFSSLAKASLVSRQVSDLVSSAPFLTNATSPYRVSSESRAVIAQAEMLLETMSSDQSNAMLQDLGSRKIIELLKSIEAQTLALAKNADTAQGHKADAALALGEIATVRTIPDQDLRHRLNGIAQSASSSDSLFQLGELQRRYVAETSMRVSSSGSALTPEQLGPYSRIFEAQTRYLLDMFTIRAAISRLHTVSRDLSHATETQSELVAQALNQNLESTSSALRKLLVMIVIASLAVLVLAILSIRSVMRVSHGIGGLARGMYALARGEDNVGPPVYSGTETELIRLLDAFRAFKESVDRVSRLRRTAEAAARTIRSTFRTMNEGIALFDANGVPITMNRRIIELLRQTGSSRKMALRRFVTTVPEINPALLPSEREPGSLVERQLVRHRFSDDQVVEISASRQQDGGVVLLARDVTAMDRQEVESARAQRLDVVMRMTHQVSHEVGNMIGIITGSLGLLERESGFTEKQKRHLGRIRKAAERGRALASSMLSIGSQQQIRPAWIDVSAVIHGMADVLEMAIGSRNRLELVLCPDLPTISLDPALLEQSILNLCLNAYAAMPEGGVIRVETHIESTTLIIIVLDEGVGMSPEVLDKALEPYFTTRSKTGGSGLGLAMVYGFVRQSGGDVRITSRPGDGTRVELCFPLVEKAHAAVQG